MAGTALITGVCGQDGAYLAQLLIEKGYQVHGLTQSSDTWRLKELGIDHAVTLHKGDLSSAASLQKLVEQVTPTEVYNLAALSFVGASWERAEEVAEVNALGALRLLDAVRIAAPKAKFFQASSSEIFAGGKAEGLQTEESALHPRNPYGTSKLFAHSMVQNFRTHYEMFACCGILYNHESPLRGLNFVTRKITDGVARIKLGLEDHLTLGSLDAKRDWGFAGDYVKAMWLMLQQETPNDFIIATGQVHSVEEFLIAAFNEVGITDWKQYIKTDERFVRPSDPIVLKGSHDAIAKELGWSPETSFEDLVSAMVQADIARLTA